MTILMDFVWDSVSNHFIFLRCNSSTHYPIQFCSHHRFCGIFVQKKIIRVLDLERMNSWHKKVLVSKSRRFHINHKVGIRMHLPRLFTNSWALQSVVRPLCEALKIAFKCFRFHSIFSVRFCILYWTTADQEAQNEITQIHRNLRNVLWRRVLSLMENTLKIGSNLLVSNQ